MPQPALTVFLIIAAIAIVVVLIAVIVIALRAQCPQSWLRRWKRQDDEGAVRLHRESVKPQAEARRLHISRGSARPRGSIASLPTTPSDKDGRSLRA